MKPFHICLRQFLNIILVVATTPVWSQFYEPRVVSYGHGLVYSSEILDFNDDGLDDIITIRSMETPEGTPGHGLYVYTAFLDNGEIAYSSTISQIPNGNGLWKMDVDFDGDTDFIMEGGPNIWHLTHYIIENKDDVFSIASDVPNILKDSLLDIRTVKDLDHDGYPEILYAKDGLFSASFLPGGEVTVRELIPDFPDHEIKDAGDFNHDGYDDLVIYDKDNSDLLLWLSDGALVYHSVVADTNFGFSKFIGLHDYSSEGQLEILVFHYPEYDIRVIRPDISGGDPSYRVVVTDFPFSSLFYAADFNADGFGDFAAGVGISSFYLNDGIGNFTEVPNDLRNDLEGSIISASYNLPEDHATIYLNANTIEKYTYDSGQYDLKQVPLPDLYLNGITNVVIQDIDQDGYEDIIFCAASDVGGIAYIEGNEGKAFGDIHPILIDEINVNGFSLEDFDGDGLTDILYSDSQSGMVKIKYGNGSGKFCCVREVMHGSGLTGGIMVSDFEDDGFPDVMISSRVSKEILLIRNHGGMFQSSEVILSVESFLHDVCDLDFDGDADVFISFQNQNIGAALLNDGLGNFITTDLNLPYIREHEFHDFDFDGQKEYVAYGNEIVIHRFNGLQYEEWITVEELEGSTLQYYTIIDYNKDGYDDLLFADYGLPFQLFLNDENKDFIDDGLFSVKFGFEIPNSSLYMDFFTGKDFDSDGDIDLFYNYKNKFYWVSQILGTQSLGGIIYWDRNNNNQQDSIDTGIPDMKISATKAHGLTTSTFSDVNGHFHLPSDTGTYQLLLTSLSECWKTDHENPMSIIIAEAETDSIVIPFYIEGDHHKVFASLTQGVARCNQEVVFTFKLNNDGCKILNGLASIILDPIIDEFVPLGTIPHEVNGHHISFRADSLLPGESRVFKIRVTFPGPEFVGFTLRQRIIYLYELADGTVKNLEYGNSFVQVVRCAYDPNDKLATPDRSTEFGDAYIEEENLYYTIRFQNTGNDTAFMVRLEDTLSPLLDLASFRVIDASHPNRVMLNEDLRLLIVHFENILLPDSTTNLAASQGHFAFTIRPYGGLSDYSSIYNDAGIYFDLNPVVLTNTTELIYLSDLSILETGTHQVDNSSANLHPNPSSGIFYFDPVLNPVDIEVYDLFGRRIKFKHSTNYIDLSRQPDGMYYIVLTYGGDTRFLRRLVVAR